MFSIHSYFFFLSIFFSKIVHIFANIVYLFFLSHSHRCFFFIRFKVNTLVRFFNVFIHHIHFKFYAIQNFSITIHLSFNSGAASVIYTSRSFLSYYFRMNENNDSGTVVQPSTITTTTNLSRNNKTMA